MKNNKIGLALEGGGAKGSYEIGAYTALKELGINFDMVAGTSIGSLNAALIAQNDVDLAKDLWLNVDSEIIGINNKIVDIYKHFKIDKDNIKITMKELIKIIKNKGLDITQYKNTINKYIDENIIRNSKLDYGLVTIRLSDLKPLELTIKDIEKGKLTEYILASSYLPVFKMNKIIDNSYYIDGGISNNLPITLLEKNNCNKIYAIKINGVGNTKKKLFSTTEIIEIKPTKDTGPIIMFDNTDIKNNYYMGYYDTYLELGELEGYKYYFKKFIFYNYISREVEKNLLELIKLKYKTSNIKEIILKSIEDILENNKVEYYKIYNIRKIIKYIKRNNLKSKNKIITDFVYKLKFFS